MAKTDRTTNEDTAVNRLAEFFPTAVRIRIPVSVTASRKTGSVGKSASCEETTIEFGTAKEVLFTSALPLEFNDTVRLKNPDGSFEAQGSVVAVQLGSPRTAVAVRFNEKVQNWIIQSA
ncbi:MAG TPA: hypothetical protein VMZ25_08045 [Terriglobales bacterium]|nr:hypothetical protein [Terriglobales bacterium]